MQVTNDPRYTALKCPDYERSVAAFAATRQSIGRVVRVTGARATVGVLAGEGPEGHSFATVGRFVGLRTERSSIVAMITEATADLPAGVRERGFETCLLVDLMGEIRRGGDDAEVFRRGVSDYPSVGADVVPLTSAELRLVYAAAGAEVVTVGTLHQDVALPAQVDVRGLVGKHFALLGATGVGKSNAMAMILDQAIGVRPDLRIFLIDGHNEYGRCFGDRANVVTPRSLKIPFWLFNFEELTDVIYGGRPAVAEELEILAEVIPVAKAAYPQRGTSDRVGRRRLDGRSPGYTVDTPVPYTIQDLLTQIDERMGRLENRPVRMHYHRLMARIETIRNDPHYAFMFENANVGGDTMGNVIAGLFRLDPRGKPVTVMQMAGLPAETIDAVVCVLCRLAFELGVWGDGAVPLLLVCEEAHRYASADPASGFNPTRRALTRIAREGRKYGISLGLVTQRPAELDPTIIAQCGTLFALRMANDRDQALLRSAVSDAGASLLSFVPTLGIGEAIAFGEGVPVPVRLTFTRMPEGRLPKNEALRGVDGARLDAASPDFIKAVVERWRGASTVGRGRGEDEAEADAPEVRLIKNRLESALLRSPLA